MTTQIPEPDLNYLQKVLLEMLAIPSPTGFTDTIVRYVAERLEELGIPFRNDPSRHHSRHPQGQEEQPRPRRLRAPRHHRRRRARSEGQRPPDPGARSAAGRAGLPRAAGSACSPTTA